MSKKFFDDDARKTASLAVAMCEALPFESHLSFVRLNYFGRLIHHGPSFLLAAVDMLALTRNSFYKLIVADLVSVYEGRGHGYGMPNPGDDVRACCEWIYSDLRRFRKLVLRARAAAVSHNSIVTIADAWHSDLMDQCDAH